MTTDKGLKAFIAIAMHIYVLLHNKTSVKGFRLTREGLVVQEDKIADLHQYDEQERGSGE